MTAALMVSAAALQVPPDVIPPGAIDIAQSFFAMVAVIALGIPIIRVFSRRLERGRPNMSELPLDLTNRLERIEQSVEAVAIEVERMAEAQRFTAKLMAEQRSLPGGEAGAEVKAIAADPTRRSDAR